MPLSLILASAADCGLCFCSLQRPRLALGRLAGKFEGCSEHTTGLVFSILALSHPTQPARV